MKPAKSINHEFADGLAPEAPAGSPISTPDLIALVQRVRGFDHDNATPVEQRLVVQALRMIAEDVVARSEYVVKLQHDLEQRLTTADFCREVSEVVTMLRPVPATAPAAVTGRQGGRLGFWGRKDP